MKKRKIVRYLITTLITIALGWTALTIYVERTGPAKQWILGDPDGKKVLIVYDPDPFYNLDEQICKSFGKALAEHELNVKVATVAAADSIEQTSYDVLIYCANTYNWRPDWSITQYIARHQSQHSGKPIVAITLGAGSTEASRKFFEKTIADSGGKLIESYSLWLWRPNDKKKLEEPNVEVAVSIAYDWGKQIAQKIK
jgi:hypothetical protein